MRKILSFLQNYKWELLTFGVILLLVLFAIGIHLAKSVEVSSGASYSVTAPDISIEWEA